MKRIIILFLSITMTIYSENPIDIATDYFKAGDYDGAINALKDIESIKKKDKDDVLYLLGKINAKKENSDQAIIYFQKIISEYPKSSKVKLSYINLGRQYNELKEWDSMILWLSKVENIEEESNNNNKLLSLLSYAYYRSALKSKGLEKEGKLEKSAHYYSIVVPRTDNTKDKVSLAKVYGHLYKTNPSKEEYKTKGFALITILEENKEVKESRIEYIKNLYVIKKKKSGLDIELELLGSYWRNPGFYGEFNLDNTVPINNSSSVKFGLKSKYNPYTYKSFNFLKSKDLDNRFLQWTFDNKGYIKFNTGSKENISNSLKVEGSYRTAEDNEDNSIGVALSDKFSIKANNLLTARLYSSIGLKVFPNYLINSNKIDYLIGKIKPELRFNITDSFSIDLEHQFTYKGYTQATYADPDNNRYYLINRPAIDFNFDTDKFDISLLTGYEILNSYNYDYTVVTPLITSTFENYEDNTSPFVQLSIKMKPIKQLRISGDIKYAKTDYINKYARDKNNNFTGDKRSDTDIEVGAEIQYKINKTLSVLSRYNYINKTSNMKYENSFITNVDYQTIFAGLSLNF